MNWVSPIKDAKTLANFETALKNVDIKYYIMFKIGVGTGLQLQDILQLKVKDVNKKEEITVRIGARQMPTVFRVPEELQTVIAEFIRGKAPEEYLIRGHLSSEAPLTREQAYRVFRSAGRAVGLNSIGAQTMRKTFAWNYYQKTGDIYYLQKLFNHASPSITYRYIGEKPNLEHSLKKLTKEENERCQKQLKETGNERIQAIRQFLDAMEQQLVKEPVSAEYCGQADSVLTEMEALIEEFQKLS